jgi:hypothetical protein
MRAKAVVPFRVTTRFMKVFSLSISVVFACAAVAADPPKPQKSPTPSTPLTLTYTPAQAAIPPTLNPSGAPLSLTITPAPPQLVPVPQAPGGQPPLRFVPATPESTGRVLTFGDKNEPVAPGVYLSSPHTAIVAVPGAGDSKFVNEAKTAAIEIPAKEPELKLTPKTK